MSFLRALVRDWKRYQNRRKRAKHWVRGAVAKDTRDWSGAFMRDLKTWSRG